MTPHLPRRTNTAPRVASVFWGNFLQQNLTAGTASTYAYTADPADGSQW
jgi:hypothetical protein